MNRDFCEQLVIYTYYEMPWKIKAGDQARVHIISKILSEIINHTIVYSLGEEYNLTQTFMPIWVDNVIYVLIPRKFYGLASRVIHWRSKEDLNPLIKLTHYIDEALVAAKLAPQARCATIYIFGSMSLLSFFLRLYKVQSTIIYDPLANYAQTLYLRSRNSILETLKYGLYLALHKLQLKASNLVVYPSTVDLENAKRMFRLRRSSFVPNPYPLCYENLENYTLLRSRRASFEKPYFVLLPGARGKSNEDLVKLSIKIFNEIPFDKFELFITGPWQDITNLVKNPSIKLLGTLPHEKLKELLATADYGLAPVFSHAAGTFLKTLAYMAAGLDIVASPQALAGIDLKRIKSKIYLVRSEEEFEETVRRLVSEWNGGRRSREVLTCDEALADLKRSLEETFRVVER